MKNKRAEGRANRKNLAPDKRKSYSKKICETLQQFITDKKTVMLYNSIDGEVDLSYLKGDVQEFLFPRVEDDQLVAVRGTSFEKGSYGIMEPVGSSFNEEIDVVIVPMCAFDNKLNRLGFGKGYYDRFLKNRNTLKIGVAFSCQQTEDIIKKDTDVTMDYIVTEKFTLGDN